MSRILTENSRDWIAMMPFLCLLVFVLPACESENDPTRAPGTPEGNGDTLSGEDPAYAGQRRRMVEMLAKTIDDERVLGAMKRVPRHEFVPQTFRGRAYEIHAELPIAENQTISSPEYVSIMTAALQLEGHEKVLEIGTGSGYQAAILGELVNEVYTMEIRSRLASAARKRLEELKERGVLNYKKIEVIAGNGYRGYDAAEPYDGIIVTAAPTEVPVDLLKQLKIHGRMVIPVGEMYQKLQIIERMPEGHPKEPYDSKIIQTVRFVPMVDEEDT